MTYDELLRLATMGGGTGPDVDALRARSSLPAPPQPAMLPTVPEPRLAAPADFGSAVMGQPGIFERVAQAGENNPIVGPISVLSDLVSAIVRRGQTGVGDLQQRRGLNALEADLDKQGRLKQQQIEEENRQANREREKSNRANRLQALRDRITAGQTRINLLSQLEQTPDVLLESKQLAKAISDWQSAEARIIGEEALAGAPSPLAPAGGKRAGTDTDKKDSGGGYVQVLTDSGPRFMRAEEAAAKGLPPANVRTTRVAQPSEREAASLDVSMLDQLNNVRQSFREGFTGPISGRVGGATQIVGGAKSGEAKFRQQVNAIANILLKMRSGAAVTEQEYQRFKKEAPSPNDPYFREKLESFWDNLYNTAKRRREVLEASGVDTSKFPPLPPRSEWGKDDRPKPNAAAGSDLPPGATQVRPDSARVP